MNEIGVKDREDVLTWCAARIGRTITSRKDLTVSECSQCIEAAKAPPDESSAAKRLPGEEG